MKILICNDDGIQAAGIRALSRVLVKAGHEVYVVAPSRERSAMSHALTLHRPIRVNTMDTAYFEGVKQIYVVDGTPTDCAKMALSKILDFKPDLLVSGINHGPNMGADIIYSGTVSIAMEGTIYGIKSIAFSLNDMKTENFYKDAELIPGIIDFLMSDEITWPARTLFNVNLPSLSLGEPKGIKFTNLGSRMYTDDYDMRLDPRGKSYYWLSGEIVDRDEHPYSDVNQCSQGYISITPVSIDLMNHTLLDDLRKYNANPPMIKPMASVETTDNDDIG